MSEHFQFTATQANMKRALALAKDFVSKASMLPVLHSIMLTGQAGDQFLTLTATNLESVLRIQVTANILNTGAMCATYTVLRDLVNMLPKDEPIEFKVQENMRVEIVSGGRSQETNLILFDPQEFPTIPEIPTGKKVARALLNGQTVNRVAAEVAPLAATDSTRPTLAGVSLQFGGGSLVAAATDGFRLARLLVSDHSSIKKSMIVPGAIFAPLSKMVKLLADAQELAPEHLTVELVLDEQNGRIFWVMDDGYIAAVLINGEYPDFAPIIPRDHTTRAMVEAKTVHQRAQVVGVVAAQGDSSIIYLDAVAGDDGAMFKMNATSAAVGDADGNMPAVVDGPDLKMAVNSKYLTKSLAIFNDREDDVVFCMKSAMEPLMLTWRQDDSLLHLIMPMHSQRES